MNAPSRRLTTGWFTLSLSVAPSTSGQFPGLRVGSDAEGIANHIEPIHAGIRNPGLSPLNRLNKTGNTVEQARKRARRMYRFPDGCRVVAGRGGHGAEEQADPERVGPYGQGRSRREHEDGPQHGPKPQTSAAICGPESGTLVRLRRRTRRAQGKTRRRSRNSKTKRLIPYAS